MKRAVFIHGWYGHPTDGWWPWLKTSLEERGFNVLSPQLPHEDKPQAKEWVEAIRRIVGTPDNELLLIGHSLGCITILKYLSTLKDGEQIKGSVLVAGFTEDLNFDGYDGSLANFFEEPIDWNKVCRHCPSSWVISSDNDPTVSKENHDRLLKLLGAQGIWEHGKLHMTGDDGIFELPSTLEVVNSLER